MIPSWRVRVSTSQSEMLGSQNAGCFVRLSESSDEDRMLDKRDKQDVQNCTTKFKLTKTQIVKRAKMVDYVGPRAHTKS